MARKKYIGKPCAYCGKDGISETRDHVVAKEFFLEEDRANLPFAPACGKCNGEKSRLEHYVLSVLPFGNRHFEARRYAEKNIGRRLQKNQRLRDGLVFEQSGLWEQHPNGVLVPTVQLKIDAQKVLDLISLIVRGLFTYHWNDTLDADWKADPAIFHPDFEERVIGPLKPYFAEPAAIAEGDLGRGTFVYKGLRSSHIPQISLWQLTLFGGLQFGGDAKFPDGRFAKFSIVTRQTEAAVKATQAVANEAKKARGEQTVG